MVACGDTFTVAVSEGKIRIETIIDRALDKREYLVIIKDNFCKFYIKTYVVTPHLNRLVETVHIRGHIIWFEEKKEKLSLRTCLFSRTLIGELCKCYKNY